MISLGVVVRNIFAHRPTQRAIAKENDLRQALIFDRSYPSLSVSILKSSQLHRIRLKKRNRSESLTFSTLCTGKSSRWWTRAAPGGKTVFISAMPQAG